MHIKQEFARKIDRFFDMYGYACNEVEVPDISSRYYWNYIQTHGLNMIAPIPQESADAIIKIFENGIRFWKDPNIVGEYTQYADHNVAGWTPSV